LPLSPSITGDLEAANQKWLAIYGYPGDKYRLVSTMGINQKANQWGFTSSGKIAEIKVEEATFSYKISTLPGQSGCPIIEIDGDSLSIAGIHKGSCKGAPLNVGRMVTGHLIDILQG
jgi:V8-like Glu-specific endopeptidase